MRRVFADSLYWIALANPADQWHQATRDAERELAGAQIVTTEEVLTELLAALSGTGAQRRIQAAAMVRAVLAAPNILVQSQSHESFTAGLDFYEQRTDKGYSLTDCISMNACRQEGIPEVLTNDQHFAQEGFLILISR
jgi:predicted nucleic acid-binding protein